MYGRSKRFMNSILIICLAGLRSMYWRSKGFLNSILVPCWAALISMFLEACVGDSSLVPILVLSTTIVHLLFFYNVEYTLERVGIIFLIA